MRHEVTRRIFRGREFAIVAATARAALGDDAVILGTRAVQAGRGQEIEVLAAAASDIARFTQRTTAAPIERGARSVDDDADPRAALRAHRPLVIALVGPTGAGKTTSAVKLALNTAAFGTHRVGLVTLDTYRAGAVAQLETYAEVARLPMEVVYDAGDVSGALQRLAGCDVVIVDTPGRGPKTSDDDAPWRALLAAIAPDELHLVIPATMRPELAEALHERLDALVADAADTMDDASVRARGVTHALLTKLDEVPDDDGVADLAARLGLPVRWIADGQEIPNDLAPAAPRLLAALGQFVGVMPVTFDRLADDARRRAGASGTRASGTRATA